MYAEIIGHWRSGTTMLHELLILDPRHTFPNTYQCFEPLHFLWTEWFVPRTRFRLWLSNQMWRVLPYTPWKNMMIELPLKIGNSISLKDYNGTGETETESVALSFSSDVS